jgi:23S rRNA pseudouridine955/2504/2580 synthase
MRPSVRKVSITLHHDGQRLDNFLLSQLPGVPKSAIYRLLRSGQVRVNGGRCKPDKRLSVDDEVRIPPVHLPDKTQPIRPPDRVLQELWDAVFYEDDDYLAINKPEGLAAHSGSGVDYGVIEAARAWNEYEFLELAHRLDRDTSGVLLLCKSRLGLLRAQAAFRDGLAEKHYFALLCGHLSRERDVDYALVRTAAANGERFVAVDEDGKEASSRFTPVKKWPMATACNVQIFSGRTHQIRVHAAALGHPVAGDRKYGHDQDHAPLRAVGLKRLCLHSRSLALPSAEGFPPLRLEAGIPDNLSAFMDKLPA